MSEAMIDYEIRCEAIRGSGRDAYRAGVVCDVFHLKYLAGYGSTPEHAIRGLIGAVTNASAVPVPILLNVLRAASVALEGLA